MQGERYRSSLNLLHVDDQFSQHDLLERLSSLQGLVSGIFVENQLVIDMWFVAGFLLCSTGLCAILCQNYTVLLWSCAMDLFLCLGIVYCRMPLALFFVL